MLEPQEEKRNNSEDTSQPNYEAILKLSPFQVGNKVPLSDAFKVIGCVEVELATDSFDDEIIFKYWFSDGMKWPYDHIYIMSMQEKQEVLQSGELPSPTTETN